MIVIRNCFPAKPGNASKLAAILKEAAVAGGLHKFRIMTDMTGDFNRVVLEWEAENLTELEARLKDYGTNPKFREKMAGYTELWNTGHREIFQIT